MRTSLFLALGLASFCLFAAPATVSAEGTARPGAVQSPVLTIDSERLFEESRYGRQTIREIDERGAQLAAENRRIEEELSAEEKDLTDRRSSMSPAEFRVLADAFDEKVQTIRREQDAKTRQLNSAVDEARVRFLNTAVPVLEQLMRESGAAVVLELRSVFISSNAVDITATAIQRIDEVFENQADAQDE